MSAERLSPKCRTRGSSDVKENKAIVENTTSSPKPEVDISLHCRRQKTAKSRLQATCTDNLVNFGDEGTDMQTI